MHRALIIRTAQLNNALRQVCSQLENVGASAFVAVAVRDDDNERASALRGL